MDELEIYGYVTGNGAHGRPIMAKAGVVQLEAGRTVRWFRFPEEPPMTYRFFGDPDWVALPFGVIPTPGKYPYAIPVVGKPGLFIELRPRGHTTALPPPSQPSPVILHKPKPPETVRSKPLRAAIAKPKRLKRPKAPAAVLKIATTRGDIAQVPVSPDARNLGVLVIDRMMSPREMPVLDPEIQAKLKGR